MAYMANEDYTLAQDQFETYLEVGRVRPESMDKIQRMIKTCAFAKTAVANPVPFEVYDLGPNVNTKDLQYHPSISIDGKTLIYTQSIPHVNRSEDFYYTERVEEGWSKGQKLPGRLNTSLNEGVQSVTADGRYMFYTVCHDPEGRGSCDIYRAELMSNGQWGRGVNLGDSINTPQWETQPSVSPDGKTLYFVRARRSNEKSSAILMSTLKEDGTWTRARGMSRNINTKGRETSPFIHFDNKTFYFASDGHPGMGKRDIFVVRKGEDGQWGTPENLGYPINSQDEESGLVVASDGVTAFFASDRLDTNRSLNLYSFALHEAIRPNMVSWMEGLVLDIETRKPLEAHLTIVDLATQEEVWSTRSESDGFYFSVLVANASYAVNVDKPGYLLHSQNFTMGAHYLEDALRVDVELTPIKKGNRLVLHNIFFATDSYVLREASNVELEKLYAFLQSNPDLKVRIDGHTDNQGSAAHNMTLSKQRAQAVRQFLVDKGVAAQRLSIKGFGDTKPMDSNGTEEGRANNRRTELTVL